MGFNLLKEALFQFFFDTGEAKGFFPKLFFILSRLGSITIVVVLAVTALSAMNIWDPFGASICLFIWICLGTVFCFSAYLFLTKDAREKSF